MLINLRKASLLCATKTNTGLRGFAAGSPKFVVVSDNRQTHDGGSKHICRINSGNHEIISDLTSVVGGKDLGVSPKELLWSALGSCTVMTIRTYYEAKMAAALSDPQSSALRWENSNLKSIIIKVEEHGDHPHVPDKVTMEIRFEGTLSSAQKDKLLSSSKFCPVKKIMTNNTPIEVTSV